MQMLSLFACILERKDKKMKKELENYKKLIESVIAADEKLDEKKYDQAQQAYQKASNRSRYADNLGKEYIEEGLEVTADYLSVYDLISSKGQYQVFDEKTYLYVSMRIVTKQRI